MEREEEGGINFFTIIKNNMPQKHFKISFDASRCGGAGECIDACAQKVWDWQEREVDGVFGAKIKKRIPYPLHSEKCIGCMRCAKVCPLGIIQVEEKPV
jgi:2-oxoglutarate ferredoxin oxidoreductase subunit delta